MSSNRNIYCLTPPREPDKKNLDLLKNKSKINYSGLPLDPESLHDAITLLKARLQYAQLKIATGMSTESLQQIEHAFLSSPRQPRIPLPQEYPPLPAQFSSNSKKIKRVLLSTTAPQNFLKKKKIIRKQNQNDAVEEEAARTILMLSSSKETPLLTPPRSESAKKCVGLRSPDINQVKYYSPSSHYYKKHTSTLYDAVAKIPNYEKISRRIGKSLPKRPKVINAKKMHYSPPPAVVSRPNQDTGSPHQYYQYDRPLPPPPKYYQPLPKYDHLLPEDPFYSRPIIPNNISNYRHKPPPAS